MSRGLSVARGSTRARHGHLFETDLRVVRSLHEMQRGEGRRILRRVYASPFYVVTIRCTSIKTEQQETENIVIFERADERCFARVRILRFHKWGNKGRLVGTPWAQCANFPSTAPNTT